MRIAAIVLAALTAGSVAHAAPPGMTDPDMPPIAAPVQEMPPPLKEKSPELAAAISIGATSLGYAMILGSRGNQNVAETGALLTFLGPSTGQWYSGKVGAIGIGARSVALGLLFYGILASVTAEPACWDCAAARDTHSADPSTVRDVLIAGAALWIGSTIYDVWAAYHEADARNQRVRAMNARLTPMVMPTANNSVAPGVGYALRF